MAEQLPQLYNVTYSDAEGEIMMARKFLVVHNAGEAPIEREMRFQEIGNELNAASHQVHFMRPQEVRRYIREVRREQLWHETIDIIMKKVLRTDIQSVSRIVMNMSMADAHMRKAH